MLFAQLSLAGVTAAITALISDWIDGLFVMVGGLAAAILTLFFALRAFSVDASEHPQRALRAMVTAEAGKLAGAVLFFVAAAYAVPQHFIPILIGFGAATASYWLALRAKAGTTEQT